MLSLRLPNEIENDAHGLATGTRRRKTFRVPEAIENRLSELEQPKDCGIGCVKAG